MWSLLLTTKLIYVLLHACSSHDLNSLFSEIITQRTRASKRTTAIEIKAKCVSPCANGSLYIAEKEALAEEKKTKATEKTEKKEGQFLEALFFRKCPASKGFSRFPMTWGPTSLPAKNHSSKVWQFSTSLGFFAALTEEREESVTFHLPLFFLLPLAFFQKPSIQSGFFPKRWFLQFNYAWTLEETCMHEFA